MKSWRILSCELFPYAHPFQGLYPPLVTLRRGFFLRLHVEDETGGKSFTWGECAPLEGFGRTTETYQDCWSMAQSLRPLLPGREIAWQSSPPFFRPLRIDLPLSPALRFALEAAIFSLVHRLEGPQSVSVSALLFPQTVDHLPSLAQFLRANQYKSAKVKIGRGDWQRERHFLREIKALTDGTISFRLDANCAFSWDEFLRLQEECRDLNIDYIEEPFNHIALWEKCAVHRQELPLAVDENLMALQSSGVLASLGGLTTIVLKPSLLGGINETVRLMNWANELGCHSVLSSAYNCGRTLVTLACLSQVLGENKIPQGLGTAPYLGEDSPFSSYMNIHGGLLPLAQIPHLQGWTL